MHPFVHLFIMFWLYMALLEERVDESLCPSVYCVLVIYGVTRGKGGCIPLSICLLCSGYIWRCLGKVWMHPFVHLSIVFWLYMALHPFVHLSIVFWLYMALLGERVDASFCPSVYCVLDIYGVARGKGGCIPLSICLLCSGYIWRC